MENSPETSSGRPDSPFRRPPPRPAPQAVTPRATTPPAAERGRHHEGIAPWLLWSLSAITGFVILSGLFGMIGFLIGALALVLIVTVRATRNRTRKADPMRFFGRFCILLGLAIILLTIPAVRWSNEREHRVSLEMAKLGYVTPVQEASPWPGVIGGAAVLGFGVLILAIRRPRGE